MNYFIQIWIFFSCSTKIKDIIQHSTLFFVVLFQIQTRVEIALIWSVVFYSEFKYWYLSTCIIPSISDSISIFSDWNNFISKGSEDNNNFYLKILQWHFGEIITVKSRSKSSLGNGGIANFQVEHIWPAHMPLHFTAL